MEMKELLKFIDIEDKRLHKHYGYSDNEKRILARNVKLAEEVGELSNEVLASLSFQRKSKLDKAESDNLSEEFADVIITALILAKAMDVDINKALDAKVEKVKKRSLS
ncbi:MAG: MazG-like family protein [Candidatus Woesearchaeota archaeon]